MQKAFEEQQKTGEVTIVQMQKAASGIRRLERGYHSTIAMHCNGPECPMAKTCPLLTAGFTYMLGTPCPLESHLMTEWTNKVVKELRINPDNHVEVGMAAELAKIDIFQMRLSNKLAYEDFIKQQVVGISDDGEAMYRDELHVAAVWDDMLAKRRLKYMDALLATRKSVAGVGGGMSADPSTQAAQIRTLLEKKKKELNTIAEDLAAHSAKPATPSKE